MSRRAPLLSAIAIAAVCIAILVIRPRNPGLIGDITDVSRYEEVRASFEDSPLVSHFPQTIPPEATDAQMLYVPSLFQGGTIFQLRLSMPAERIAQLQSQYEKTASQVLPTRATAAPADSLTAIPVPFLYTGETQDGLFPETYTMLLILAQPQGDPDFAWNHGYSSGVAIDPTHSQIVYWAEDW